MQSAIESLTSGKGLEGFTSAVKTARSLFESVGEGRDFGLVPIIYFIGWVFIAYLLIYFLAIYVGPALFGTTPWGRPYYARNMPVPHHHHMHGPLARSGPAGAHMSPEMMDLTARVTQAASAPQ